MTSDPVIQIRDLGKRYRLGAQRAAYRTLRESLSSGLTRAVGSRTRSGSTDRPDFWALRHVDLDVSAGEVVGIIGRNGAGKSTLLKLLSRVTSPTEGSAVLHGRVGSLLEVGTGFHPELTGRENILLNGAILGMSRGETLARLDDIVEFSEISAFIDTPVKRYSSGMYVRLAFAVAAHLEPEIMIVDEVLAVGDAAFQRKCLGKMRDVAVSGRTVLFVSHNMGAITQLCSRAIWLDEGQLRVDGSCIDVTTAYLRHTADLIGAGATRFEPRPGAALQLLHAQVTTSDGVPAQAFRCDENVVLDLLVRTTERIPAAYGLVQIRRRDGTPVLVSDSRDMGGNPLDGCPPGDHALRLVVPRRTLAAGEYEIHVSFASPASLTGFVLDDPGVVAGFQLDDDATIRGNARQGFLSTLIDWEQVP